MAVQTNQNKGKKAKVSIELRKSLKLKQSTSGEMDMFKQLNLGNMNFDAPQRPPRQKKSKPVVEHPSTANCYSSVFLPYGEMAVQDIKDILVEISWCIYAAAVARQRTRSAEPFMNQVLTRPKETFASFVYNVLGLGIVGKMKKNPAQNNFSLSKAIKNAFNQQGADGSDADKGKPQEFTTFEPNKQSKPVKPILKKNIGVPESSKPTSPSSEQHPAAPHDRKVVFRPEVQVFYTDEDDDA